MTFVCGCGRWLGSGGEEGGGSTSGEERCWELWTEDPFQGGEEYHCDTPVSEMPFGEDGFHRPIVLLPVEADGTCALCPEAAVTERVIEQINGNCDSTIEKFEVGCVRPPSASGVEDQCMYYATFWSSCDYDGGSTGG
jgi:hypothetical protein